MQTPGTPKATTAPTPDTPDTPETVLTGADSELWAADSELRGGVVEAPHADGYAGRVRDVLRSTPQRARAAVQAVIGRIIDAPDDERFQRINAESRTFRESGLDEGRALLAALGFVADGLHIVWGGDLGQLQRVDNRIAFGAAAIAFPGLPEEVVETKLMPYLASIAGDVAWEESAEAGDAEVLDLLALDSTCRAFRRLAAPRWCRRRQDVCRAVGARRRLRRRWRAIGGFAGSGRNRGRLRGPGRLEDVRRVEVLCGRSLPLEFRLSVLRHHDGQDFDTFAGYGCLLKLDDIALALQNYNYERSIPLTGELDHARLCLETRTGAVVKLGWSSWSSGDNGRVLARWPSWGAFLRIV
jgi:hypothetical protein